MRRPVQPRVREFQPYLTVSGQMEPVLRDGRPERIPAQPVEARGLTRGHDDARMQIETVLARVAAPEGPEVGPPRQESKRERRFMLPRIMLFRIIINRGLGHGYVVVTSSRPAGPGRARPELRAPPLPRYFAMAVASRLSAANRSEERRVGKECRL